MFAEAEGHSVQCGLCNHFCRLQPGQKGICGVRENRDGQLISHVYGKLVARNCDPIEKKPLFHVLPASTTYSIATPGCNFRCLNCQNHTISQVDGNLPAQLEGIPTCEPRQIVAAARSCGCASLSYTYTEPTVFFEFAYDCCLLAKESGLGNMWVSNGYMSRSALDRIAPLLTAANIDLKSSRDEFYRKICGARLQPVIDTVVGFKERGVWVEVTSLIIPGLNDTTQELQELADLLVGIDPNIPWHVSGFFPTYKLLDRRSTPAETLSKARDIGFSSGLQFVYEGNRPENKGEDTVCPQCRRPVIRRNRFQILENSLISGECPSCHALLPGCWS